MTKEHLNIGVVSTYYKRKLRQRSYNSDISGVVSMAKGKQTEELSL
jgi:hypothetical protein